MNWAISISERLHFHKALKNLTSYGSSWVSSICQGAALLALTVIPFFTYSWLTSPSLTPVISTTALFTNLFIPYILGWIYFGSSLWINYLSRGDDADRAFVIFCSAAAVSLASIALLSSSGESQWLWSLSTVLAGGSLISFALLFPKEQPRQDQNKRLIWLGYALGLIFIILWIILAIGQRHQQQISTLGIFAAAYLFLAVVLLLGSLCNVMLKAGSQVTKQEARRLLWGLLLSVLPVSIGLLLTRANPDVQLSGALLVPLAFFPIMASYNSYTRQIPAGRSLIQNTVANALLSAMVVIAYFLLVSGASMLAGGRVGGDNPLMIGLIVFLLAIGLNPVRNRLQNKIDATFQRGSSGSKQNLQAFAYELTRYIDVNTIVAKFQDCVTRTVSSSLMHLYLYNSSCNQYTAVADNSGRPTSDIRFPPDSAFVRFLATRNKPFEMGEKKSLPEALEDEYHRIALLGTALFVPLPGQKELVGWLTLNSQDGHQPDELTFLESLCGQAAIAIDRSMVISNLERRVREMDALTRIAQGVNITLDFDNILELIYAQTNLVIPTVDFRVTLQNPSDRRYYHAFYLEDDERLAHNENINIPIRNGLEEVVIQNQRSVVTSDYERECRRYGVIPNTPGVYAWMGVPLNAGSETIGAVCLGCRDSSIVYTAGQCDLLQAIADQAAGAIIKSQLLSESERRARQLTKLNEVGRSLTSTLEIKPLLTRIMNSAVEILNCEAGNLIMVDENSNELVFEVTVGPISDDLSATRLPPGTGLVGKVAETGEAVIANHASDTQIWLDEADQQTGFLTRDFLAVPMKVKQKTIGVIEVINRLDGATFTQEDLEILSTFTSQAAIAVENARLYTQTDDALSARLEEMSVMQRIDRELNASLDVDRTMRITLDWSLDYSNAEAGLIGFLESGDNSREQSVRVIAYQGFNDVDFIKPASRNTGDAQIIVDITAVPSVLFAVKEGQPSLSTPLNNSALASKLPENSPDTIIEAGGRSFLSETSRSQAVIPIRRKTDVIGLILLESSVEDKFTEDAVAFLTRLSDHAAIAISNALLYADLQAANVAKSEFVSLVSHELKTPMTSIRGYTDLLAQGTVGPINEIQSNFLNTIRSNVNRMANLVSDLADVSRIEAGRMRLEFGSVSISKIIDEVLNSVNAQLAEKDHALNLAIPDGLPNVWGDHNRLIQVMNNLLSNAIKYTPQHGRIDVSCQVAENTWGDDSAPRVVLVSVKDSGFGISPEEHGKIFQKFFRSGDQNIRDVPGTGLGLNITRHLVEMQGGRIWFDSMDGNGSTFYFTIPVAATD